MKRILSIFIFIFSVQVLAGPISFNQIIGKYSVESNGVITQLGEGVSIKYEIVIHENETMNLTERVVQNLEEKEEVELMKVECFGPISIDASQNLISRVKCPAGENFIQKIDLSKVQNIENETFKAPVFSSLYGMTVEMIFTRK